MATRFYLPVSGTSPLNALAVATSWEHSGANFFRAPAVTAKSNSALTDKLGSFPDATTDQMCWGQWVSKPIAAFSFLTSHTISMVVRGLEANANADAHLAYTVRVVSGDGTVDRGTIAEFHATSTELLTTAATRIHSARALNNNVSAQNGDRIVIELGSHGVTPSTDNVTWRFGDPSATADFALTAALTTDLCPWVELSPTLTFGLWGLPTGIASAEAVGTPVPKYNQPRTPTGIASGEAMDHPTTSPYYGAWPTIDGAYTVRCFLKTGVFVTPAGVTVAEVLVVAGGASGGGNYAGGGGAGGVKTAAAESLSGTMTVTVGAGAPRGTNNNPGASGENSEFGSLLAHGGGGGGSNATPWTGYDGGSGGGASVKDAAAGGKGTTGEGRDGGAGKYDSAAGGGGGAGAVGQTGATNGYGGKGGIGVANDIIQTGVDAYYAGGGGGYGLSTPPQTNPAGGGGEGATQSVQSKDGTPNTGGGGGGGYYQTWAYYGGGGGSGIVVLRYLTPPPMPTGIASAEAVGTPTILKGDVSPSVAGIASGEAMGGVMPKPSAQPSGIASGEAMGVITRQYVAITGIPTAEAHGTPAATPDSVARTPEGIASAEQVGTPTRFKCLVTTTQLGLICQRCTRRTYGPSAVTLTLTSRRKTLRDPQAVTLTMTSRRRTRSVVNLTLESQRKTVEAARVRLTLESQRKTGVLARLTLTSSRHTDRRVITPGGEEDIVTVLCSFNGIDLNNGTTTHVMSDGNELGVDAPAYDVIRHYDGSLVLHDVRDELSTLSIKCRAHFGDAASLESWLAGLRAACAAGGSLSFAPTLGSPVRTFTIVPSPGPQVNEDNHYFIHHVATFDLQLTRWAE